MEKLCNVKVGSSVTVDSMTAKDLLKERLMSLGLTRGTKIDVLRKGPKGNLTVFRIRGTMIALRCEESSQIYVNAI